MKLTKWLFLLSLILFPLGELVRIPFIKDVVVKPFDIVVGLTTLSFVIYSITKKELPKTPLRLPIAAFVIVGAYSLLIQVYNLSANQFITSAFYLIRWIAYVGIFFVVSSFDQKFKKQIFIWLTGIGIVVLLLGFIQYIFYPDLRNLYYLGWDEHLYRLFSTFLDPNFAGAFLSLFLLYLFSLYQITQNDKYKIGIGLLSVLTLLGILLTYSRSAMFMLIVSSAVYLILQKKIKLIVGLFVIILLFFIISTQFVSSEGTNLLRTASSFSRIDSAEDALIIIRENPIAGVGFNAYRYVLERNNVQNPTTALEQHANSSPDSSLLFILATTGVVGGIAYLYLLFRMLKQSHILFKKGNIMGLYVFSCVIGLLINSIFINSLFFPFIIFWVWVHVGLIQNT